MREQPCSRVGANGTSLLAVAHGPAAACGVLLSTLETQNPRRAIRPKSAQIGMCVHGSRHVSALAGLASDP